MTRSILTYFLLILSYFDVNGQISQTKCCENYCYASDYEKPQTKKFSTKTAYVLVKGSEHDRQYIVPHCQHKKIWFLGRHGTRLPSAKDINKLKDLENIRNDIVDNYETRGTKPDKGPLCTEDYQAIKYWKFDRNITEDHEEYLTRQGWEDLKLLARNYQSAFPDILEKQYNPSRFLFRHTNTERTEASYKAFVEGLFGNNSWNNIHLPPIPPIDTLLRPYDFCPLWDKQKDERKGPESETTKYEKSQRMNKTIADISTRLGFKYWLEREKIELMWDMCRYEQAWVVDRDSAWCAAFTRSEVDALEYGEDISYFYKSGHSSELNSRMGCELVQDMLKHLENNEEPNAVAYFTHSSAIQLFLVALGIAKDRESLRADNYNEMSQRSWRTSAIGPFSANLAAIKYECDNEIQNRTKIMFFLNQKPVELHWCKVGLCDWEDVKRTYGKFIGADCKSTFCNMNSSNQFALSSGLIVLILLYFTI